MTITYSCVANGRAVLAELALTGGSYQLKYVCEVAQEVCSEGKKTQSEEEGYRHWIRQQEDDCRSLEEIVQAEARLLRAN
ncbi:hypothetical protein I79_019366 [Cricetulus griseus]|uniref:Uncharacterized protein n=1 Tax=Cricetulus griseus TaxID=10029 RepID=G3I781_CRIGR|nr:hypothetical protein I79_019366 [Cricetulus griseus]ERE92451.1 hypothetical protein H671_1g0261 [Cricetulus griseus]